MAELKKVGLKFFATVIFMYSHWTLKFREYKRVSQVCDTATKSTPALICILCREKRLRARTFVSNLFFFEYEKCLGSGFKFTESYQISHLGEYSIFCQCFTTFSWLLAMATQQFSGKMVNPWQHPVLPLLMPNAWRQESELQKRKIVSTTHKISSNWLNATSRNFGVLRTIMDIPLATRPVTSTAVMMTPPTHHFQAR